MQPVIEQLNAAMSGAAEQAIASLVQISNDRAGVGAGTIWHSDGLIVTNAHVVAGHGNLSVRLQNGEIYPAQLLAEAPQRDLAVLSIQAEDLPTIELGDSRTLRAGDWVMALGHPFGLRNALSAGIVIAQGQQLGDLRFANGQDWLAVNLPLRPGHSGGPLIDAQGCLVGVNTIMNGPAVGVAIPVHVVKAFLKEALGSPQRQAV